MFKQLFAATDITNEEEVNAIAVVTKEIQSIHMEKRRCADYEAEKHQSNIMIVIKNLIGKRYELYVDKDVKIEELKVMMSERIGVPPDKIMLTYSSRQLEEGYTINEYGITNNSILHIVLRAM